MFSKIQIINLVLNELGRPAVTNENDSNDALVISSALDLYLPFLLTKTDWNFAIKYVENNTPNTVNFSSQYNYTYTLPFDFNRLDRFNGMYFQYRLIDGLLLCFIKPVKFYYVSNLADYDVLTPNFVQALVKYTASMRALVLTNNERLEAKLKMESMTEVRSAIIQNDMNRRINAMPFNDFNRQYYV